MGSLKKRKSKLGHSARTSPGLSEEHKAKIKRSMRKPEVKERLSKAALERWKNKLFRETMIDAFSSRRFKKQIKKMRNALIQHIQKLERELKRVKKRV